MLTCKHAKFLDFLSGLTVWLVLDNCLANGEGMDKGGALSDAHRGDLKTLAANGQGGFLRQVAARRNRI